ncbi:RDH16-like protein [Mya arenaria]|uniref:RDH16-like protein n=1 Tax=Mya arenaria TaxID=6604 RepID=A0ABY7FUV0_MYAAR|nr:RDH16-like protein [Mya arenaria]
MSTNLMLAAALGLFLLIRWILRRFRVRNYADKYVFITGCDTGFGNLLAKRLDRFGINVFAGCLTSDGAHALRETCSKRLNTLNLDVTNEESIAKAKLFVEKRLPKGKGLWAVVNNAGVSGVVAPIEWLKQTISGLCWKSICSASYSLRRPFCPLCEGNEGA